MHLFLPELFSREKRVLLLILILALGLRLWGIRFGLPGQPIIDEGGLVYEAFYAGANLLKPVRVAYTPLIPYFLLFEFGIYFIFGRFAGVFNSPENFYITYLRNPTALFTIARATMAVLGMMTVWLMWLTGRKFFGKCVGLTAAFFLAVVFLHVKESHYIKQDIPMVFFTVLIFYYSLFIIKYHTLSVYFKAAISAAFLTAVKYLGSTAIPLVFVSHFLSDKKMSVKPLLVFILTATVTFCLINPYFSLNIIQVIRDTWQAKQLVAVSYPEHLQGHPVWWWFMFVHLPEGLGIVLFMFSILGFGLCLIKARKDKQYLLLPVVPVLFFLTIGWWSKIHLARYGLLVVPFFIFSAAILINDLLHFVINKKLIEPVLVIICLLVSWQSIIRSIKFDKLMTVPDTRLISKNWIEKNLPANTKILVDSTFRPEYQANLNAPVRLNVVGINKRIEDAKARGIDSKYLESLRKANQDFTGYDIVSTIRPDRSYDINTDAQTEITDADYYYNLKVEYLVLSDWPLKNGIKPEFTDSVSRDYSLINVFRPNPAFPEDPHFIRMDYKVLDNVDLFENNYIFGPTIKIYKIK